MHRWMMVFNTDKCKVLQISLSNLTPANYYLYNNQLRHVEEAKYLGVLLDFKNAEAWDTTSNSLLRPHSPVLPVKIFIHNLHLYHEVHHHLCLSNDNVSSLYSAIIAHDHSCIMLVNVHLLFIKLCWHIRLKLSTHSCMY